MSTTAGAGGTRDVRVSDAERQRAIALLQHHTGEGRLTLDEFEERVGEVYAARTTSELAATLRDLPAAVEPRPADAPRRGAEPGRRWPDPRRRWRGPSLRPVLVVSLVALAVVLGKPWLFAFWPLLLFGFFAARGAGGWGACGTRGEQHRERVSDRAVGPPAPPHYERV